MTTEQQLAARKQPILVSAGLIYFGDKLLIAQRPNDKPLEASKWDFPGGKVNFLESPEEGLAREVKEELALSIKVSDLYGVRNNVWKTNSGKVHAVLLFYNCSASSQELKLNDHQDARWIEVADLSNYDFAAADLSVVTKLLLRF